MSSRGGPGEIGTRGKHVQDLKRRITRSADDSERDERDKVAACEPKRSSVFNLEHNRRRAARSGLWTSGLFVFFNVACLIHVWCALYYVLCLMTMSCSRYAQCMLPRSARWYVMFTALHLISHCSIS